MSTTRQLLFVLLFIAAFGGCRETPVLPELRLAEGQQSELRAAGVSLYAPTEFQEYLAALTKAQTLYEQEQQRWTWLRDFEPATIAFQTTLLQGAKLSRHLGEIKKTEAAEIATRHLKITTRLTLLRNLSETLKDRRLAYSHLVQAELKLTQVERQAANDHGPEALRILAEVERDVAPVIDSVQLLLGRYAERKRIAAWRQQVDLALAVSRQRGEDLLVVSKAERRLTHYRRGQIVRNYEAGMSFNFLSDKLYSGDQAMPEGVYLVSGKIPGSKFFRALRINYPNQDDHRRYDAARQRGQIPKNRGIGNLIEIHGGGRNGMTDGCVALDDLDIGQLYEQIKVETPVIILGTTNYDNLIAKTLKQLQ